MNRCWLGYLVVGMFLMLHSAAANLVANGSFEDVDEEGWAQHWKQWPELLAPGASVSFDANISHSGIRSLRIVHRRQDSYSRVDQIVPVTPGKRYMISCWVRGQDLDPASNAGGVRLFIGRNGSGHSFRSVGPGREARGTFPWTRYEIGPVEVGEQRKLAFLPYLHKTSGTVWFDDIKMVEITPDMDRQLKLMRVRNILLQDATLVEQACRDAQDAQGAHQAFDLRRRFSEENDLPLELDRRHGPPFFARHRDLYRVLGEALERRFPQRDLVVWRADPFARQSHLVCPPETPSALRDIDLLALRDDTEQIALNLTNVTGRNISVRVSCSGTLENVQCIWREAIPVELREGRFIDDALPRAMLEDGSATIAVPAGMTRQVWLEVRTGKTAGSVTGTVTLQWGERQLDVPVRVRVLDLAFPSPWPLYTFCYAYLPVRALTKDHIQKAVSDLTRHHINAIMPHAGTQGLPDAVFADDGTLLPEKMDWTDFDRMLEYSDYVRMFVLMVPPHQFKRMLTIDGEALPLGSPVWEERAVVWVRAVIEGLRRRGIGYDRMVWTCVDEPSGGSITTAARLADMLHRADPNIRVYSNFYSSATPEDVRVLDPHVDVWAPALDCLDDRYLPICKARGRELWAYRVQGKGLAPASIRGAFWKLHRSGVKAYSFWTYVDASADPWTPYDIDRHDYHIVYNPDSHEMIPSKRWEAWREGVEDVALLAMLTEQGVVLPQTGEAPQLPRSITEDSEPAHISQARRMLLEALAANLSSAVE